MGILTALLFAILLLLVFYIIIIQSKNYKDIAITRSRLKYIKSLGQFSLAVGVLGQMVGLYAAFTAIEVAQDISTSLMMGGLKVSMITPMYGIIIFLISYLAWLLSDFLASKNA